MKNGIIAALTLLLSLIAIPAQADVWAERAGGSGPDRGNAVVTDTAGNIYLTGTFSGTVRFGSHTLTAVGTSDIFIGKKDKFGRWLWVKRAGGSGSGNEGKAIAVDGGGNIYVAGVFEGVADFGSSNLSASSTVQVTASPPLLTFTADNWNIPQAVTLRAIDDPVTEGAHIYTVHHQSSSSDNRFENKILPLDVSIIDNDTSPVAGLTLTENNGGTSVSEGTTPGDSYTLVLTKEPAATVTVTLAASDPRLRAAGVDNLSQLVFTTTNWQIPQTVMVTVTDDFLDQAASLQAQITHTVASEDPGYNGLTSILPVTVGDNDSPGILFLDAVNNGLLTGQPAVTETAATGTSYRFTLATKPTADVTVTLDYDPEQLTVTPTTVTFTPADWNDVSSVTRTVTVHAVDDAILEGSPHPAAITHTTSSSDDPAYQGVATPLTIAITDNDSAGVTLSATSLNVSEGGATGSYQLRLDSEPSSAVTVAISPAVAGELAISPATVTFLPGSATLPRTVSVTAVEDTDTEYSPRIITLHHAVTSVDNRYEGISVEDLRAAIVDNDPATAPQILLQKSVLTIPVTVGGSDNFGIVLATAPTETVTVTTSFNTDLAAIAPSAVSFDATNWNVPQIFTLSNAAGNSTPGPALISFASSSLDASYNAVPIPAVTAQLTDARTPGFIITEAAGGTMLTEGGGSATYTITLQSEPAGNVTVTLTTPSPAQVTVSPSIITFTGGPDGTWNLPRSVTVTAVDDTLIEGGHSTIITHTATSGDPNYQNRARALTLSLTDNDTAGATFSTPSIEVAEGGSGATYQLRLNSQPTGTVTVTITPDHSDQLTITPATVSFTPENWQTFQTVSVTALYDTVSEGNMTVTLFHHATGSDSHYQGIDLGTVTVAVIDNTIPYRVTETITPEISEDGLAATYHLVLNTRPDSNVTVQVSTNGNIGSAAFIAKLDSSGTWLWSTSVGNGGNATVNGMAVSATGEITAVGTASAGATTFGPFTVTGPGGTDPFAVRISGNGTWHWAKKFGGTGDDQGSAVIVDPAGNAFLTANYAQQATTMIAEVSTAIMEEQCVAQFMWCWDWEWVRIGTKTVRSYTLGQSIRVLKLNDAGVMQQEIAAGGDGVEEVTAISYQDGNPGYVYLTGSTTGKSCFGGERQQDIELLAYYNGTQVTTTTRDVCSSGTTLSSTGGGAIFAARYRASDLGFVNAGGWARHPVPTSSSTTPVPGSGRAIVVDGSSSGGVFVTGESNGRIASVKFNFTGLQQGGTFLTGDPAEGTAVALGSTLASATGEVYVTGSLTGNVPFTDIRGGILELVSAGERDMFLGKIEPLPPATATANWKDDRGSIRTVGSPLSPPILACNLLPEIVDSYGVSQVGSFFWHTPEGGQPNLYPLREVNVIVKWKLRKSTTDPTCQDDDPQNGVFPRITEYYNISWPETPWLHPSNTPVRVNARGTTPFRFNQLLFNEGSSKATITSEIKGSSSVQVFNATGTGYSVMLFVSGNEIDPAKAPGVGLEVVLTAPFDAPLFSNVQFSDNVPWTIGTEIIDQAHTLTGENGYLLSEKPPIDMGEGGRSAYDRTNRSGQIIPVNDYREGVNDQLVVVWFDDTNSYTVAWPSRWVRYTPRWPANPLEIVIASGIGSELPGQPLLETAAFPEMYLYQQPDRSKPGFNPNDEHALFAPSNTGSGQQALFALRNDLTRASAPYLLLKHRNPQNLQKWAFTVYRVVAENSLYPFSYDSSVDLNGVRTPFSAGKKVFAPYPLSRLLEFQVCRESFGSGTPYWEDWKGGTYARSAGEARIYWFYPLQEGFFYDLDLNGVADRGAGECVAWLGKAGQPPLTAAETEIFGLTRLGLDLEDPLNLLRPVASTYTFIWPSDPPSLGVGETLLTPKRGLPMIKDQAAAEIIYDEQDPDGASPATKGLARLIDPVSERWVTLEQLPEGVTFETRGGKQVLSDLPFALRSRVIFDPLNKRLVFKGYLDESGVGEPLVLLNVLTSRERDRLLRLSVSSDYRKSVWNLYRSTRNPARLPGAVTEPSTETNAYTLSLISPPGQNVTVTITSSNPSQVTTAPSSVTFTAADWSTPKTVLVSTTSVSGTPLNGVISHTVVSSDTDYDGQAVANVPLVALQGSVTVTPGGSGGLLTGLWDDPATTAKTVVPEPLTGIQKALSAGLATGTGYLTLAFNNHESLSASPITLEIIRVDCPIYTGEIKVIDSDNIFDEKLSVRHSGDFAGDPSRLEFEWYYRAAPPYESLPLPEPASDLLNGWARLPESGFGVVDITIEGAGPLTISDNLLITRYRGHTVCNGQTEWSQWAGAPRSPQADFEAQLAEGWIKRVLDKLNPYEARGKDFERSATNTFASMLVQAGTRYEGPIALNNDPDAINEVGLIEAYSTVLDRGRDLSIDAVPPVQYEPANASLLLAAGRIADLYLLLGNEAYGDAQDPTIGFGTESSIYGTLAPTIFAFQNQLGSLLEEELTLLRGRDNPSADPVYNRLFWNFTRGEGELAYSQVYNISDQNDDGVIDEKDAGILFPQGHGDAWGHYLTAIKTYYQLLRHPNFDWQPRAEKVLVAGSPVDVDYLDERKFAQAAAARARTAAEIVDLTYRSAYVEDPAKQWQGYKDTNPERGWGLTEWARRGGQGAYLDWVAGNAILPEKYGQPTDDEIQKIDRTTVRELAEIAAEFRNIEAQAEKADQGLNPLGLAKGVVPFDIDPSRVANGETHFEQIHDRAVKALQNAARVFNYANQQSEMLRRNEDSLEEFRSNVGDQEQDLRNRLIEAFGYPYADDIGPGGTYPGGYDGPDLYHYMYVDASELTGQIAPQQQFTAYYTPLPNVGFWPGDSGDRPANQNLTVTYQQSLDGYGLVKPAAWSGRRRAPGELQSTISDLFQNRARFEKGYKEYEELVGRIKDSIELLEARYQLQDDEMSILTSKLWHEKAANVIIQGAEAASMIFSDLKETTTLVADGTAEALPKAVGLATDATAPARSAIKLTGVLTKKGLSGGGITAELTKLAATTAKEINAGTTEYKLTTKRTEYEVQQQVKELEQLVRQEAALRLELYTLKEVVQQSIGRYLTSLAKGERLLEELIAFRQGTASKVQAYRYQDMTFRVFRNDALQKYRATFDLAARYTYLAATAYDYETNLLGSNQGTGRKFLTDIVRQRNLGQLIDSQPLAGSPGLADPLARMAANFNVYKGQLGFNNPQTETNRFSLRTGLFRLRDGADSAWRTELEKHRVANLWDVPEFRRFCRSFAPESAGPQPGLVIPLPTTVSFGLNFFGFPLSGGDSAYDATNFATRVRSVGAWFSNYNGSGLAETPRVYLVPAGMDVLRSPSANTFATREWRVIDQVLPVPFPIGSLDLADPDWTPSASTLSDDQTAIRRFSSFRAYHDSGTFTPAELSSDSRLIGRSVWNTRWLLIIPGGTLLSNANEGLDTLIKGQKTAIPGERDGNGITDIKLFFQTYSYSGN